MFATGYLAGCSLQRRLASAKHALGPYSNVYSAEPTDNRPAHRQHLREHPTLGQPKLRTGLAPVVAKDPT